MGLQEGFGIGDAQAGSTLLGVRPAAHFERAEGLSERLPPLRARGGQGTPEAHTLCPHRDGDALGGAHA
jgi:hypothetical protein